MSGSGERLRAAAERYLNPSTDWRILAKPLSGAFGLGRQNGTGRDALRARQKCGFIRYRGFATERRIKDSGENARRATTHNFAYVYSIAIDIIFCENNSR